MTELAQSVAAIVLQEPDHARARPSRYFKQGFYSQVFSGIDLNIYIFCAQLRKKVELYFRTAVNDRRRGNDLLYYVLMAVSRMVQKSPGATPVPLSSIDVEQIPDDTLKEALSMVSHIYEKFGATDKAAKGTDMVTELKAALKAKFPSAEKSKKPKSRQR